jgi:hypothetical protein
MPLPDKNIPIGIWEQMEQLPTFKTAAEAFADMFDRILKEEQDIKPKTEEHGR